LVKQIIPIVIMFYETMDWKEAIYLMSFAFFQ